MTDGQLVISRNPLGRKTDNGSAFEPLALRCTKYERVTINSILIIHLNAKFHLTFKPVILECQQQILQSKELMKICFHMENKSYLNKNVLR